VNPGKVLGEVLAKWATHDPGSCRCEGGLSCSVVTTIVQDFEERLRRAERVLTKVAEGHLDQRVEMGDAEDALTSLEMGINFLIVDLRQTAQASRGRERVSGKQARSQAVAAPRADAASSGAQGPRGTAPGVPRWGKKSGGARHELDRRHHAVGLVSARLLDAVGDAPVGQHRESIERERRTGAVPYESLACVVVVRGHTHGRVNVEAVYHGREALLPLLAEGPGIALLGLLDAVLVDRGERARS
jgi:hypothetical protein